MNVVDIKIKQVRNGLVYLPNETKPFTGRFVDSHKNGQKRSDENYIDGKAEGKFPTWWDNGTKVSEVNYKDGKKDGKSTKWYGNGTKRSEVNYKDGKKHGNSTEWFFIDYDYEQGEAVEAFKKCEINYKDGKKDGKSTEWRNWFSSGKYEANYKDGELDGEWTKWDDGYISIWDEFYKDEKEFKESKPISGEEAGEELRDSVKSIPILNRLIFLSKFCPYNAKRIFLFVSVYIVSIYLLVIIFGPLAYYIRYIILAILVTVVISCIFRK